MLKNYWENSNKLKVILIYLLIASFLVTGISFSKFKTTQAHPNQNARVGKFYVSAMSNSSHDLIALDNNQNVATNEMYYMAYQDIDISIDSEVMSAFQIVLDLDLSQMTNYFEVSYEQNLKHIELTTNSLKSVHTLDFGTPSNLKNNHYQLFSDKIFISPTKQARVYDKNGQLKYTIDDVLSHQSYKIGYRFKKGTIKKNAILKINKVQVLFTQEEA